jgi:hypothetical protein
MRTISECRVLGHLWVPAGVSEDGEDVEQCPCGVQRLSVEDADLPSGRRIVRYIPSA